MSPQAAEQSRANDGTPGQSRALWLSTVAFTVCFAVWTIFSIIGVQIQKDLGLSETQFGLLPDLVTTRFGFHLVARRIPGRVPGT